MPAISVLNIIDLSLKKIKQKYENKGYKIRFSQNLRDDLLPFTEYETYGARKINKTVKDKIENQIIEKIVEGKKTIFLKTIYQNIPN